MRGGSTALEYLGARVGLPGRPDDFHQLMDGFPPFAVPARYQRDAIGATLEPGETYMLILGFEVVSSTFDERTSVVIDYTIDTEQYEVVFPAGLFVCPATITEDECSARAGY